MIQYPYRLFIAEGQLRPNLNSWTIIIWFRAKSKEIFRNDLHSLIPYRFFLKPQIFDFHVKKMIWHFNLCLSSVSFSNVDIYNFIHSSFIFCCLAFMRFVYISLSYLLFLLIIFIFISPVFFLLLIFACSSLDWVLRAF